MTICLRALIPCHQLSSAFSGYTSAEAAFAFMCTPSLFVMRAEKIDAAFEHMGLTVGDIFAQGEEGIEDLLCRHCFNLDRRALEALT